MLAGIRAAYSIARKLTLPWGQIPWDAIESLVSGMDDYCLIEDTIQKLYEETVPVSCITGPTSPSRFEDLFYNRECWFFSEPDKKSYYYVFDDGTIKQVLYNQNNIVAIIKEDFPDGTSKVIVTPAVRTKHLLMCGFAYCVPSKTSICILDEHNISEEDLNSAISVSSIAESCDPYKKNSLLDVNEMVKEVWKFAKARELSDQMLAEDICTLTKDLLKTAMKVYPTKEMAQSVIISYLVNE